MILEMTMTTMMMRENSDITDFMISHAAEAAAFITLLDTIMEPTDIIVGETINYEDANDTPEYSIVTQIGDDLSIEGILEDMGNIINTVGNDDDPALKSPDDIKSDIDSEIEIAIAVGNTPTISDDDDDKADDDD